MSIPLSTTPASIKYPQTAIITTIHVPVSEASDYIAPICLPRIFPGTSMIPGIAYTSIKERWNKAGLSRTIYFKDSTTSREALLTYNEQNAI